MRRIVIAAAIAALNLLAASCAPVPGAQSVKATSAPKNFETTGFRLFQTLSTAAGRAENTFVSPLSIRQAIGLAHAGARGATASEIESALVIPSGAAGDAALGAERKALLSDTGAVSIKLANALWLNKAFAFRPDYLEATKQGFAARADRLDFTGDAEGSANTINRWAAESTNGLIQGIIEPEALKTGPAAVLTNAVFFEGAWQAEFAPARTEKFLFGDGVERPFPLMGVQSTFAYAESGGWKAVRLPYRAATDYGTAPRFVMDVFVPVRRNPDAVLPFGQFSGLTKKLTVTGQLVEVTLPRFEIEWKEGLNEALMAAGIRTAFDPGKADFSGMLQGDSAFSIGAVVQASKLQVFETGTRAAAVTSLEIVTTGARRDPLKPKIFRADQPFHVVIRDLKSDTVLFVGRIARPAVYNGS